jgi:dTMP kinase
MAGGGRLVAIEGSEGAGKSTQASRLAEAIGAMLTREPGGTPLGERLRTLLLEESTGPLAARTELLLMLAQRAEHMEAVIEPALAAGSDVVVDRFTGSTLAYQGYGRGLPLDEVRAACDIAVAGRDADLYVLIDVPLEVGEGRRTAGADRIEKEGQEFHRRVREGFLDEATRRPDLWQVINGDRSPDDVAADVLKAVSGALGLTVRGRQ